MIAIALALMSSVAYGLADFGGAIASRRTPTVIVSAIGAVVSLMVMALGYAALGGVWSVSGLAWGAAAGVGNAVALASIYASLALGPISVVSPITALVSAVIPVAAGLAFGEHISPLAGVGIVLALAATVAISASSDGHGARPTSRALVLAVIAGASIAATLVFLDRTPDDSGVTPLVAERTMSSLVLVVAFLIGRRRLSTSDIDWRNSLMAGLFDAVATIAFVLALRAGQLAIVAVIIALYPAATVLLARFVLHERLARIQLVGLGVAACSVALLALA